MDENKSFEEQKAEYIKWTQFLAWCYIALLFPMGFVLIGVSVAWSHQQWGQVAIDILAIIFMHTPLIIASRIKYPEEK